VAACGADGKGDPPALGFLAGRGLHRFLPFGGDAPADVFERVVAPHGPGEHPRLEEDLEAVAESNHVPAALGEPLDLLHDGGEPGDGAGAQVVAVGEPARQNDHVGPAQVAILVPDVPGRAAQDVLGHVVDVVVAVAPGEDDHREEHQRISSTLYSSMTVFARSRSHMSWTRFLASAGSLASRSSSMILPRRASLTSLKPSEPRARVTA